MIIIGAGMAGLLAARMLVRRSPRVLERQHQIPNNHHAVLRFRTEAVSTVTNIPFKRVRVLKEVFGGNGISAAVQYSRKVTGRAQVRSIIDTDPVDRFIAPPDFIAQLAAGTNIEYGYTVSSEDDDIRLWRRAWPVISTMPMPKLMDLLDYSGPRPEFRHKAGVVWTATVPDCDLYATIYFPSDRYPFYRASITGDELMVELATDSLQAHNPIDWEQEICAAFGLGCELSPWEIKQQPYAKLDQMTERERQYARAFMHWATINYGVYSLGRFATWRAGLLMDDLVQDVQKIDRWIGAGNYAVAQAM